MFMRPSVLVADDLAADRQSLVSLLEDLGHDVRQAADGAEALEAIAAAEPDLVLLDIDMPRMDGLAACRTLKDHPTRRLIPVILITPNGNADSRSAGVAAGADDFLWKPFDPQELRLRSAVLLRERELNKRLHASEAIIFSLARAIEARDLYTLHHAERVAISAREIGRAHGLPKGELEPLYQGALLHDLGKIAIPDSILLKRGTLTSQELHVMQSHSEEGERIAMPLRSVSTALPVIRHHHERFDGEGYPDHLAGDEIPFGARATAIGDGWDAMTNDRAYRDRLGFDEAFGRLKAGSGSQWDPALVEIFAELLQSGHASDLASAVP